MTTDLELEAREAIKNYARTAPKIDPTEHWPVFFEDGYLAAATLREEEIEELRAEVNDWRESAKKAAGEPCGDEAHCACVPLLRAEIATLRARVAVLWGMVPRWVVADTGYPVKGTEFERLYSSGWRVVQMKDHCPYHSLTRLCLMAPPIPVPETKVNASQQGA